MTLQEAFDALTAENFKLKERLREAEPVTEGQLDAWRSNASYVLGGAPPRCRCGGSCESCAKYEGALRSIGPDTVLRLIAEVARLRAKGAM